MNIIDKTPLLTPAQKSLLEKCAKAPFMLGGFMSLDDIVTKLNVDVIIEPDIYERQVGDYYDQAIEYWKKLLEQLKERMREDESLWNEYRKALDKLERLRSYRQSHSSFTYFGLYDSRNNIIKLFPEAMAAADASKMDEYLVSTLAHEVMHAYFNRPEHERFPYAMFVEEPLAEFGMLLYLHETHNSYYDWAHGNVSGKNSCYRYGANIMDQYLEGDYFFRKCIEEYKTAMDDYAMLDISNGRVSMPEEGGLVNVNGQAVVVIWNPVSSVPPTYFWDAATRTLGLDGDWRGMAPLGPLERIGRRHLFGDVQQVYLGKDFRGVVIRRFGHVPVFVSPQNKEFTSIKGIPVRKKDHLPLLEDFRNGFYKIVRNGKCGVVDSQLNIVIPLIYESISQRGGEYEVELNGEVFTIDKLGNRID